MAIGDLVLKTWQNGIDVTNAANLQRFESKLYELDQNAAVKNSGIIVNKSNAQTITTTNATKVQFNSQLHISGSKLTFDSGNYGIKIGAGVSYVDISLVLWVERIVGAYFVIYIYKNSGVIGQCIMQARQSDDEIWCSSHVRTFTSVSENDMIYGYALFSSSHASDNKVNGSYLNSCNLMVKAIS